KVAELQPMSPSAYQKWPNLMNYMPETSSSDCPISSVDIDKNSVRMDKEYFGMWQLEGYHKLRDSNERNHSSGSVHYNSVVTPPDDIHHFAHYETKYGAYYGTRAKINLWGHPYLKRFQRSSTMLWVLNFDSGANVIEAGFHIGTQCKSSCKLSSSLFNSNFSYVYTRNQQYEL
ncbi:hypothetical protein ACMD2_20507, partial [Ananas comosus]